VNPYFGQPAPDALPVLGFEVVQQHWRMSIVEYQGAFYLRDGYHRATGLLMRGITHVPVLVGEAATYDQIGLPAGSLPLDTFLGQRPPYLGDYVNDEVSAEVLVPAADRLVIVQGLELTPRQL
jgi:hypothetical protein